MLSVYSLYIAQTTNPLIILKIFSYIFKLLIDYQAYQNKMLEYFFIIFYKNFSNAIKSDLLLLF